MVTDTPLTVTADKTFAEVPHPTVVIVPGGGPPTIRAMGDEAIRDYLRQVTGTAHVVARGTNRIPTTRAIRRA
jgi:hypothetical protein